MIIDQTKIVLRSNSNNNYTLDDFLNLDKDLIKKIPVDVIYNNVSYGRIFHSDHFNSSHMVTNHWNRITGYVLKTINTHLRS